MFKLLCFSAFVAAAHAIVCLPDTCKTVRCAALTAENCADGKIVTNGGFCGCCDACITMLAEGDMCMSPLLFGVPATSRCADGLVCDSVTNRCKATPVKRELTKCKDSRDQVDATYAAQPGLTGLERPHCNDTDGTYLGMQFAGSQAYCVTKEGESINGYMVNRWETGPDMNCQCARDQYAYMKTGLIGKMFHCEMNGNYATQGCTGSVCYCQDKYGKPVGTSTVNIGELGSLNC